MKRIALLIIVSTIGILQVRPQVFFAPEVVINTSGVRDSATRELSDLEIQLTDMFQSYAPNISIDGIPKNPIRLFLLLNITSLDGSEYTADMELAIYRPVYGKLSESLIFIISERDVRFRFQSGMSKAVLGRTIPEDPIQARAYYYATLGLMYYYDSFSIYGGKPILDYLEKEQSNFERLMSELNQSAQISQSSYAPGRQIMELQSEWGERFREIWYIYHRIGLDSEDRSRYGQTLYSVLSGLKSIRDNNASLSFFQLFSDTKRGEIRTYFTESKDKRHEKAKNIVEELYPNLLRGL